MWSRLRVLKSCRFFHVPICSYSYGKVAGDEDMISADQARKSNLLGVGTDEIMIGG